MPKLIRDEKKTITTNTNEIQMIHREYFKKGILQKPIFK
jgi:hypothetical protein